MTERLSQFELPYHVLKPGGRIPYYSNAMFLTDSSANTDFNNDSPSQILRGFEYKAPTSPLQIVERLSMNKAGQELNTAESKTRFVKRVDQAIATGEPIDLVTIVCPPYKRSHLYDRESYGLEEEFETDPLDYNFAFNYKVVAFDLAYVTHALGNFGAPVKPHFVIGDWAFRGAKGLKQTLPSDQDILYAMDNFTDSANRYFAKTYPELGISADRFSQTELRTIFPIGMPNDPKEKKELMKGLLSEPEKQPLKTEEAIIFYEISKLIESRGENIVELTNQTKWPKIKNELPELFEKLEKFDVTKVKPLLINFLKLYGNTLASRYTELGSANGISSAEAGFYDALMKSFEYIIYGRVFSERYTNPINMNWDTKFPCAGLFYQVGNLDTIFLDPNKFPTPMSQLGVKVIPF